MTPDEWQRIKALAHEALECDTGKRAELLDRVCGGDAELRRQVEELLASEEQMGRFLEGSAANLTTAAALASIDESMVGRHLGAYQILREIGRGGMGTVYFAERADGQFRKRVAIKLVRPYLDVEDILQRFRSERQVLADLEHPNISRLLDGGVTAAGFPYLVMEYVEGLRIDEWCDRHRSSVADRLRLFRKVCSAVQFAHERQVIHRDIKPANILVTAEGEPKLVDFGIAKVLIPDTSKTLVQTMPGGRAMTPEYASPEQARGEPVGPASDIYALGVLLYQLLTGRLPYVISSHDPRHIATAIGEQQPALPSAAVLTTNSSSPPDTVSAARGETPQTLNGLLRGALDNIVLKALRKEPDQRYVSVAQFSEDVERYLEDRPVQARGESYLYRGRRFLWRNRVPALALLLSASVTLVLGFRSGWFTRSADPAGVRSIAVLPLENLSGDREQDYFADGITEALISDLARIQSLRVISRTSAMSYKGRRSLPEIARTLGVQAVIEGSVLRSGSYVRIVVRLVDAPRDHLIWNSRYEGNLLDVPALQSRITETIANEIHVGLTTADRAPRSRSVNLGAYEAYLKGRNQYASSFERESIEKAIEWFQRALALDLGYAPAYAGLADCYYMLSSIYLPPVEVMPKAKEAALKAIELDDRLGEAHATLALVSSLYDFNRSDAEKRFRHALELKPSDSKAHLWYSLHLVGLGRFDEAVAEVKEAQRLDPVSPSMNAYVGGVLYFAHRYDQVIQSLRSMSDVYPNYNPTHAFLALAYEQKSDWRMAIPEIEKACQLDRDQDCLGQLGHIYAASGRTADARKVLRELSEMSRKRYVSAYNLGVLHLGLGEREVALQYLQKVREDRSEWFAMLNVDPRFADLHSDSRFREVVRSTGVTD